VRLTEIYGGLLVTSFGIGVYEAWKGNFKGALIAFVIGGLIFLMGRIKL